MFDRSELDTCPLDVLSNAIGQLAALKARTERVLLAYAAAYERRDSHTVDGATSMTAWVAAATATTTTHSHAAEMVRVARSLEDLPAIADAYEAGLLSWGQVPPHDMRPPPPTPPRRRLPRPRPPRP